MKYLNYISFNIIVIVLFSSIACTSCSDKDEKIENEYVYLVNFRGTSENTTQWTVAQTSVGGICEQNEFKFPVMLTLPLQTDIEISVELAMNEIDVYNTNNNTSYASPSSDSYSFTNKSVTIKAGELESSDSICLTINDFNLLSASEGYIFPFRLSEVSKGNVSISSNLNMLYLILNNSFSNIDTKATSIEGEVCDRSSWICTSPNSYYTNPQDVLDGDPRTQWEGFTYGNQISFKINMGTQNSIKGLTFSPNYIANGQICPGNMKTTNVYTSNDGNDWTSQGTIVMPSISSNASYDNPVLNIIKFYGPVTTQYIKLEMPDSWDDSYIDVYIGEINAIK